MSKFVQMSDALQDYIVATMRREDDIVRRLREETAKDPMRGMQIAPDQGQFMALMVRLTGAKRAIEVGVFTGMSGLWVARALPDDGYLLACDVSEEWTAMAKRYWQEAGVADKIELRIAPAIETLQAKIDAGEAGSYDIAFIDADKSSYDAYYEACLVLLRQGGVILIDNVLWGGAVIDESDQSEDTQAIRALNAKVGQDGRVEAALLTVSDGITMAIKR